MAKCTAFVKAPFSPVMAPPQIRGRFSRGIQGFCGEGVAAGSQGTWSRFAPVFHVLRGTKARTGSRSGSGVGSVGRCLRRSPSTISTKMGNSDSGDRFRTCSSEVRFTALRQGSPEFLEGVRASGCDAVRAETVKARWISPSTSSGGWWLIGRYGNPGPCPRPG